MVPKIRSWVNNCLEYTPMQSLNYINSSLTISAKMIASSGGWKYSDPLLTPDCKKSWKMLKYVK